MQPLCRIPTVGHQDPGPGRCGVSPRRGRRRRRGARRLVGPHTHVRTAGTACSSAAGRAGCRCWSCGLS